MALSAAMLTCISLSCCQDQCCRFYRQKKLELELEKQRKKEERQRLKEERRREREQKRRQKWLERKEREEEERMQLKILVEERRLLIAQRKLESLRLLTELFERVKVDGGVCGVLCSVVVPGLGGEFLLLKMMSLGHVQSSVIKVGAH